MTHKGWKVMKQELGDYLELSVVYTLTAMKYHSLSFISDMFYFHISDTMVTFS